MKVLKLFNRLVSILIAVALMASAALPAQASSNGAIVYSVSTGAYGYSYNWGTKKQAINEAMSHCTNRASDCVVAVTFYNSCGALAAGTAGWGADWGNSPAQAQSNAISRCKQYTRRCRVVYSLCSN
jgi:Domain of unknown function (DUF4189)